MFGQFFILFGMIGVGYYGNRKGWLTKTVIGGISSLVMRLTCPVLLFVTISQNELDRSVVAAFIGIALGQCFSSFLGGKLMRFFCKKRGCEKKLLGMLEGVTATVNNGFIGLPIALLFFNQMAGLYMSAAFFGIHLYIWLYCLNILRDTEKTEAFSFRDQLKRVGNPNCVMVFVGLIFALSRLTEWVPAPVMEYLTTLGELSTPLSLIYIGAMAGGEGVKKLLGKRLAIEISVAKMLLFPLLTGITLYFLPVDSLIKSVFLISMAMPCAAIMPMLVEEYGTGAEMASDVTLLTTMLSMATLPLCIWLTEILF